ncbi:MAG: VWA domain-containing protein [Acidobacteria bacterium]|nr:VWA domain-containing protein [Acidobacteriota bacterium]
MSAAGAVLTAIRVLVTVLDPSTGLAIEQLRAEDFHAPVPVESVNTASDPLAVLVLLDASAAGDAQRTMAKELIGQFTGRDRVALMTFQRQAVLAQPFSENLPPVLNKLEGVVYDGDPRMMDALASAVAAPFPAGMKRKVILLLTAGIEGPSRTTEAQLVHSAREKGIAVYPVYLHGSGRWSFPGLAKQTGGAAFWVKEVRSAVEIMRIIRSPYVVTLRGPAAAGAIKVNGREKVFVSALPYN